MPKKKPVEESKTAVQNGIEDLCPYYPDLTDVEILEVEELLDFFGCGKADEYEPDYREFKDRLGYEFKYTDEELDEWIEELSNG